MLSALFQKIQLLLDKEQYYLKELPKLNPEPVIIFSDTGKIVYQNPSAKTNFPNVVSFSDLISEDIEDIIENELVIEAIHFTNEKTVWYEIFAKGVKKNRSVLLYGFNISSLIEAQNKLQESLTLDSLTRLGNRKKINQDVANVSNTVQALACMDIMKFGELNAFYGHKVGDMLLIKFSKFLQDFSLTCECMKGIYRLNGNTFAILFQLGQNEDVILKEKIRGYLEQIIETLHVKVFEDEAVSINLDVRIGASVASSQEDSKQETRKLILEAEIALKEAKKEDRDVVFYGQLEGIEREYHRNITISKKLRDILKYEKSDAQIVPYFQPIYSMQSKSIKRYEVLARIVDDEGVKAPCDFLEAAKKLKLLPKLTEQMYRKSLEVFSKTKYGFSINITTQDLASTSLLELFDSLREKYNFQAEKILFEVVEDEDIYAHKETISQLQVKGFKVAIDDFGSGYSNFKKLQDIKAEVIKIDGSLIKNIAENEEDFELVRSIVSYGKSIDTKIVAEFVSSKEIYEKLLELDVDFVQGYYIGKPEPILQDEFLDFL